MSNAKKEPGLASLVIVLAIICLVIAALLGLVNSVTEGPIADNTAKTVQDSLKIVLPADTYDEVEYSGTEANVIAVYKAGEDGYVVEVNSPNGFGGALDMMTGISNDGAITGIAIISHSETSGLGCRYHRYRHCDQGWRSDQRHHRLHHHLPRCLRWRQHGPQRCGRTGLRRV